MGEHEGHAGCTKGQIHVVTVHWQITFKLLEIEIPKFMHAKIDVVTVNVSP